MRLRSINLCQVTAMLSYLVQWRDAPGPLFNFTDSRPLTHDCFVFCLWMALAESGTELSLYAGNKVALEWGLPRLQHYEGFKTPSSRLLDTRGAQPTWCIFKLTVLPLFLRCSVNRTWTPPPGCCCCCFLSWFVSVCWHLF